MFKTTFLFQKFILIKKASKICNFAVNIVLEQLVIFVIKTVRDTIYFSNTNNSNFTFSYNSFIMHHLFFFGNFGGNFVLQVSL